MESHLLSSSQSQLYTHCSSPALSISDRTRPKNPSFPSFATKTKSKLETLCRAMAGSTPKEKTKEAKLWGGRFQESVTDAVEKFTESISFDKELYKHDIMGSKAHASMLAQQVCPFCSSSCCFSIFFISILS